LIILKSVNDNHPILLVPILNQDTYKNKHFENAPKNIERNIYKDCLTSKTKIP